MTTRRVSAPEMCGHARFLDPSLSLSFFCHEHNEERQTHKLVRALFLVEDEEDWNEKNSREKEAIKRNETRG